MQLKAINKYVETITLSIPLTADAESSQANGMSPETARILEGCLKNDRAAQEQLYRKYFGKMMATCLRFLGNHDDAMEALNLGFLKVYQNLKNYDKKGSFDGWVYRIIRNSVIDHLRKKIRYSKTENGSTDNLEIGIEETITTNLQARDLLKMLDEIPVTSRLVFNLFAIEGFKHEEISTLLGISAGTSKWHVSEARRLLKTLIEKERNP